METGAYHFKRSLKFVFVLICPYIKMHAFINRRHINHDVNLDLTLKCRRGYNYPKATFFAVISRPLGVNKKRFGDFS